MNIKWWQIFLWDALEEMDKDKILKLYSSWLSMRRIAIKFETNHKKFLAY